MLAIVQSRRFVLSLFVGSIFLTSLVTGLVVGLRPRETEFGPTLAQAAPAAASGVPSTGRNGTGSGFDAREDVVATGWYASWKNKVLQPSEISWEKYSAITYAFAITTPNITALGIEDPVLLNTFVQEAHENGVEAHLSIGGWTGSIYFSTAVATAENRTKFVKTILDTAEQYGLDGIDFDWEYPGKSGIGCNTLSTSDSSNFLAFLQELKQQPAAQNLSLTAAAGTAPFVGPDDQPLGDVKAFADVFDHVAIMNYDLWGSWSDAVGPNSPLEDACAVEGRRVGSAVSAVKAWTDAGFPASKLVLGVGAYGHSYRVERSAALGNGGELNLYPAFDKADQPIGSNDAKPTEPQQIDPCGKAVLPGGTYDFSGMVKEGFLDSKGVAAPGIAYTFDNCSATPFVYNQEKRVMISYDDATSFALKGKFIRETGLAGFAMWHVAGDFNNILLDSLYESIGIVQTCDSDN